MPKKAKKKPTKKVGKEKSNAYHDRSRVLSQKNELLRLGQTSEYVTEKRRPHSFIETLRRNNKLNEISVSVRDVGSRVIVTPGVYARGAIPPVSSGVAVPGFIQLKDPDGSGPAVIADQDKEVAWRAELSPAHKAVMSALDESGVSRMLDVRPTYVCPLRACHFHCHLRTDLLSHFRTEHVTKKNLLQSVTATTTAIEGSLQHLSTDSIRTKLGVTKLPPPPGISLIAETEYADPDDYKSRVPPLCSLDVDGEGHIVLKIPPPPKGVESASEDDLAFVQGMDWLFSEWSDEGSSTSRSDNHSTTSSDNNTTPEDEFENWIGCNHRLIYHYDHYVTARENIFLPCTIRGVRLMKDGQKVSLVVPEVMRPMKPKHIKSNSNWKLQKEHAEVILESHNDDTIGENCFTFRCAKFRSYQGTGKMARSPPVVIGGVPWRLMVYPDGNSAQDQGEFTSVFLEVDKTHDTSACWQCFVHFKLDILSSKAQLTYEKKAAHRFTSTSMNWGFGQLMSLSEVLDPDKGFLAGDGSVTFRATVRVVEGTDIEQWGGHTTYDSIKKTGMPGLPYWDGVDSPSCLRSLLQILFYIPCVRQAVFGMQIEHSDEMARPLVGLQLVFYWLHMVNDPSCSPTRKVALKQAGSQLKDIMQGCSGWDALKKFPGWEPVTQKDLRLLLQVLLASVDDQLKDTPSAGLMGTLFRGRMKTFVSCVDVDEENFESEGFCEIELNTRESADGSKDLMAGFRELTEPSIPIKYMTKNHGYQTARAGITFLHFPPILVIQLTRFGDGGAQEGEKVKDRCEFPEHINLDEFLEEPEATPADYTLHAMLVHYDSKDVVSRTLHHGQHAAFIRPDPVKGEWYKFMDPFVKKAAATEDVLEEAFGESGDFCGQAYMLVYMRDSWAGELLRPVAKIPDSNLERLPSLLDKSPWSNDATTKETIDEEWMEVEIIRQEDIANYFGVDICTFTEAPVGTLIKVQKMDTVNDLVAKVKEHFNYDTEPCLFQFIHRQNGSYRPDEYIDLSNGIGNKHVHECASSCSKFCQSQDRWHLFLLDQSLYDVEEDNCLRTGSHFLLFYKVYELQEDGEPLVRHVGHTLVAYNEKISELIPPPPEFAEDPIALDCFEEVSNALVEDVQGQKTCRQQELQNGDILVVCEKGIHNIQEIDAFYARLRNQVMVEFRPTSKPHERGFTMALDKSLEYNDVAKALAEYLRIEDPLKIQFSSLAISHDRPGGGVGRTIPPPCDNQTLEDMRHFASRSVTCQCHKRASQILLYESLDVRVTDRLLQLTRDRELWVNQEISPRLPATVDPDIPQYDGDEQIVLLDLLKDMRQLAEAIRKDVRERLADIDRDSVNLATKIRAVKEDQNFVRKQLAALDEQEQQSNLKRTKDVRKRLQAAREQRDYMELTKGTRESFEKDLASLFLNYQCQVSLMVAKEPQKMFLTELEADLDSVVGKIWKLLWGGGLTRDGLDDLVNDKAFEKYFQWQGQQMLHHGKMVKRKVMEKAEIFSRVCEKARVDPLTQGVKSVFRYHLCGLAVQDQEDKERSAQKKMDAEVDLVQQELLRAEEEEKQRKLEAARREKEKQEVRLQKETRRREEEQRRSQEEQERERLEALERKRQEELEIARREEEQRQRRAAEQEKQRREEERRLKEEKAKQAALEKVRREADEKKKQEARRQEKAQRKKMEETRREEERKQRDEEKKAQREEEKKQQQKKKQTQKKSPKHETQLNGTLNHREEQNIHKVAVTSNTVKTSPPDATQREQQAPIIPVAATTSGISHDIPATAAPVTTPHLDLNAPFTSLPPTQFASTQFSSVQVVNSTAFPPSQEVSDQPQPNHQQLIDNNVREQAMWEAVKEGQRQAKHQAELRKLKQSGFPSQLHETPLLEKTIVSRLSNSIGSARSQSPISVDDNGIFDRDMAHSSDIQDINGYYGQIPQPKQPPTGYTWGPGAMPPVHPADNTVTVNAPDLSWTPHQQNTVTPSSYINPVMAAPPAPQNGSKMTGNWPIQGISEQPILANRQPVIPQHHQNAGPLPGMDTVMTGQMDFTRQFGSERSLINDTDVNLTPAASFDEDDDGAEIWAAVQQAQADFQNEVPTSTLGQTQAFNNLVDSNVWR
eukprot:m.88228 g.88228  ORF g.88228 m.88228 type:complete len:2106 (+) comp13154_c0_seq1:166-6483(+)